MFENGKLSHFVDGRAGSGNWMSLVKCARFPDEQNLIAVQVEGQIFYEACKDIQQGQELLVWYGDCYMQFLGIPLTLKDAKEDGNALLPAEGRSLTRRSADFFFFFAFNYNIYEIYFPNQMLEKVLNVTDAGRCLPISTTETNT